MGVQAQIIGLKEYMESHNEFSLLLYHWVSNSGKWRGKKRSERKEATEIEFDGPLTLHPPVCPQVKYWRVGNMMKISEESEEPQS